jgi:cyanophycinase
MTLIRKLKCRTNRLTRNNGVNMGKSETILIAIGGGELAESTDVLNDFLELLNKKSDPRITVMTVATSEPNGAGGKYNTLFRKHKIKHVSKVDVSERSDAFNKASLKKIEAADALYFTGGDQLNVTSLLGGSPLHNLIHEKVKEGFIIAGTSAGATMMSNSMIISGKSDSSPQVGGVEIAPGMGLLSSTIIDVHFSQRGRHGRLLTAIAHYPQDLGIGIDERTAIFVRGNEFKVVGEGVVTIMDGNQMKHNNLPYRNEKETVGLFGVDVHVLPSGYKYNLKSRSPVSPTLKKLAGIKEGE